MASPYSKWIVRLVWYSAVIVPLLTSQTGRAEQIRRLYVEPFTTGAGSERLREDVIDELRKLGSVAITQTLSGADATLDGGGEIWIRGYRSLNPRSGREPSNGTPIYGGYLSVELKDAKGETFWSYLITPAQTTDDIYKDLAKRIVKHAAEALQHGDAPLNPVSPSPPNTTLRGAGATFPYPVYQKWITNYRRVNPNLSITYDPAGSETGVRELLAGNVDFGASDSPDVIRALAPERQHSYMLFPTLIGAVVPIVNLPGVGNDIAFTPDALAGIYLGKIKKWNDAILKRANPGLHLPDLDIVVVHRADGSGTSYAFTDYLSKISPEWKARVGSGLAPEWPTGKSASGNDGVAKLVRELGGSIGYVEFIYALQNHIGFGKVRNRHGEFVSASLESMTLAATESAEISDDFKVSIVDAPGAGAYPIATFSWIVVPAHIADLAKRTAMGDFLRWMLGSGQAQAAALGYLALPKTLVTREEAAIVRID